MIHPLDNPVWEALCSFQQPFNEGSDIVRYFPKNVSPFIALKDWHEADLAVLDRSIPTDRSFSVLIAKQIELPTSFELLFSLPLYQMIRLTSPINKSIASKQIPFRRLNELDVPMMLELTAKTKPGPFYDNTIAFGNYFGIFDEDRLVSMAGQRLQTDMFTEVSAICTDEKYLGRGYASILTNAVCDEIAATGKTAFLHVRQDNSGAIAMYKKLGFEIRADIYFAVFKKRI